MLKKLTLSFFLSLLIITPSFSQEYEEEFDSEINQEEQTFDEKNISDEEKEKLAKLLPDEEKLELETTEDSQYFGDDLYMYINGAAPAYHDYDFEALLVQQYKKGVMDITVEIYDMGTVKNAFGIYSIECSSDNTFLDHIGFEAYGDENSLNFYYGTCYIKLSGHSRLEKAAPVLKEVAKEIANKIENQQEKYVNKKIKSLRFFPKEHQVKHSQKYLIKDPLGHSYLAPAFTSTYKKKDHTFELVLSVCENTEEAQARQEKLKQHFSTTGEVNEREDIAKEAFLGKNNFEGEILITRLNNYVLLIQNPPENARGYVKSVAKAIDKAKQKKKKEQPASSK